VSGYGDYEEMMERLAYLEAEVSTYMATIDGKYGTEADLQRRKETSTDLYDRFQSTLALNDVSIEEYREYWHRK
jgi:hypothetical protein